MFLLLDGVLKVFEFIIESRQGSTLFAKFFEGDRMGFLGWGCQFTNPTNETVFN